MATRVDDERSLRELVSAATGELSQLMRDEVELAKTETKEEIRKAAAGGAMFGAAGFVGFLAIVMLSFAAAWGLASVMPNGFAFLIVGAVYAVAAVVCFLLARQRMREFSPVPEQTVETLKEDVEWAKARKN